MYKPTQVDVGAIAPNPVGNTLLDFADRQAKLYANQSDRAIQAQKIAMDQNRFAREQELNKRQDLEYNREIGLRDMRKNLAAEYEANPYADVWGGGAANKMLDKQVLDYVNSGKEITPDMATKLQGLYETNRPFKEDLSQVFRSKLLAAGEDPTKADAYAKSMTDSMPFSRATQQAQLDKQQEIQQGYYNAVAAANKDVAKMGFDVAKANQEASVDQAKLDLDYKKLMFGNTTGGSGGGTNADGDKVTAGGAGGLSQLLSGIGWSDAKGAKQNVDTWLKAGYSDRQIFNAVKNAIDDDSTAILLKDRTLNTDAVNRQLATMDKGETLTSGKGKVEPITSNVNAKDLLAQFAPRQIAGYNPEGMLERAKTVVPELFAGAKVDDKTTSNSVSTANSNTPVVSSKDVGYDAARRYIESSSVGGKVNYTAGTNGDDSFNPDGSVKNKSQAIGADQFLPSTLNDYKGKHGLPNFTDKEFINSPELQNRVAEIHTDKNIQALKNRGIEVNDYTKWLSHNLGAGNVKAFVEGKETDKLKSAMSAQFSKPTSIDDYNKHFKPFFDGDAKYSKAGSLVEDKNLSAKFDDMDPKSSGNLAQDRADLVEKSNVLTKILEKNRGDKDTVSELAKVKQDLTNLDYILADRVANGMKDERSVVANTITGSSVAPSAPVPKLDKNGNVVDTSSNLTSGHSIFSDVGGMAKNAYDKFSSSANVNPTKAVLATANAIAGDTLNILGSPYTAMKYGTDSLMGYNHKPSVFQNMASSSHNSAVKELSKVTDYPEEVLFAAELAAPLGSKKITSPISKVFSSLGREPELLPNIAKSDGIVNRAIDSIKSDAEYATKMKGIGKEAELRDVIRKEAIIKAEADKFKNAIKPSTSTINEGRELLKSKLENRVNTKINAKSDGKEFANNYWNRLVEDRASGKITDEELFKNMRELRDGGYISTRDLMEALDSIGIQVK